MAHELIGTLVGIARATEGNEEQFTDDMAFFLAGALARSNQSGPYDLLLKEAEEIKRRIVPNCYYCCNPCGRRANYDLSQLEADPGDVAAVKKEILSLAQRLGGAFQITDTSLLLDALIMVGLEIQDPSYLLPTLQKLKDRIR